MKNAPKILVVGSIAMDMIVVSERFSGPGETVFGTSFSTAPGGKGANQAVQAARLGADVTMVGMVGDDDFGRAALSSLNSCGVDTSNVKKTDRASTAIADIQIQQTPTSTENRITVVPGASNVFSASDVAFLADSIGEYDIVMLQNEIPMEVNIRVAEMAHEADIPVMLNPAPYTKLPAELVSRVSYISPNEHEALDMTGLDASYEGDRMTALEALRSLGVKNAMITLGKNGCVFYNGADMIHSPCASAGKVIDPTAAGDSFIGAFCTAVAAHIDTEAALRFANYTAGITVCGAGAQPSLPTLDRVLSLLRRDGHDTAPYEILSADKE